MIRQIVRVKEIGEQIWLAFLHSLDNLVNQSNKLVVLFIKAILAPTKQQTGKFVKEN